MAKSKKSKSKDSPEEINEKEMAKFRAEEDMRTLRRADEVKADRDRLRAVRTLAKEEQKALEKIARPNKKKKGK